MRQRWARLPKSAQLALTAIMCCASFTACFILTAAIGSTIQTAISAR